MAGLPRDHRRRHGANGARVPGRARDRAARGAGWWFARGDAGVRVGDPVPGPGRRSRGDRQHARSAPAGRGLERNRSGGDHAGPFMAGRRLLRRTRCARRRHGRGTHDRPHHIPVSPGAERQVRPATPVRRRHPVHDQPAGVRGRELPPPPGRLVRQAIRRQHVPLHVEGLDLLRSRTAVRRRVACPRVRARFCANPADRLQLRLALSAVRIAGDRGRACLARQTRRASRDRRALRARLLPARRGAPDAHHPPLPAGEPV